MTKLNNITLLWNDGGSLSGLQCNALASLVHFCAKWTRDASALRWRPERRLPSFRSKVMLLSFLISALFLSFFQVHPYFKWSFFQKLFSPIYLETGSMWKSVYNPSPKQRNQGGFLQTLFQVGTEDDNTQKRKTRRLLYICCILNRHTVLYMYT